MNNALFTAIGKYGLATILAGYLVYQLANQLPEIQAQATQILGQHQAMQSKIDELSASNHESNKNVEKVMRSICLILAKSPVQIQSCNQ